MKTTVFAISIFTACHLFGQSVSHANKNTVTTSFSDDSTKRSVTYQGGHIGLGGSYGIHPNYRNNYSGAYQFVEGLQKVSIKNRSFSANFRLSNEKFISGQPSFFRLSYDGASGYRNAVDKKQLRLAELSRNLDLAADSLSKIEGKLSYLRLKQLEWNQRRKSGIADSSSIPKLPGIELPNGQLPELPGLPAATIDLPNLSLPDTSFSTRIAQLEKLQKLQLDQIDKLKLDKDLALQDYNKLQKGNYLKFLDGVKRLEIGTTSLSRSSMSSNAVPVNGVNVSGEWRNYFYSAAAGFSLPNQLFSSQAFDQIVSNTGNIFNANDFFAVNSVRLVSSAIAGYGEQDKNSISVETFHSGRSFEQIKKKTGGETSTSLTVAGAWTPLKNLTLKGALSQSISSNQPEDSLRSKSGTLGYSGEMILNLPKLNGTFRAKHRNLGMNYDGWAQGVLIRGAETTDLSYKQKIKNRASVTFRAALGKYASPITEGLVRRTRQGGVDAQVKLSKSTSFTTSYTLLESSGDSLSRMSSSLNHLGFAGITTVQRTKKWTFTSSADLSTAHIQLIDSAQKITQAHLSHRASTKNYYFGLKLTYSDFSSIGRVYGTNLIIAPEAGVKYKNFKADLTYQVLKSEQFGNSKGFVFATSFGLGDLFTVSYSMQRWLPTDYVFFIREEEEYLVNPFYATGKIILHLK